jgi:hypothetical protein
MRMVEAGVHKQAQAVAKTWQSCLQFLLGNQFCQQIGVERPLLIRVIPSKVRATDLAEKEFKIEFRHDEFEKIGLYSLLQGRFSAYPFKEFVRIRVKGCGGIIDFHRSCTSKLRADHPNWANQFEWPEGAYAN